MVEISISEYETDNGRNPFGDWHHDLEPMTYARVARALARIVDDGNFGDSKSVGKGEQELRIHTGPGYRVDYAMDCATLVILLAGGTKRQQHEDIGKAQKYWSDYKRRKT